jgi:hypothetical protein
MHKNLGHTRMSESDGPQLRNRMLPTMARITPKAVRHHGRMHASDGDRQPCRLQLA